jgi:hypothetical protein
MRKLLELGLHLVPAFLLIGLCGATNLRVDNAQVTAPAYFDHLNLVKDGGLTGHRDAGSVANVECALATPYTRGCVEPADQSWTGPKRIAGGVQPVCVTHASLTACSAGNAGLHQCCSTHSNALVHCNGSSNIELTGSSSFQFFPAFYVNGLLHAGLLFLGAWQLPYAFTITGVSGFVAPGVGTTQTLRITDGTNNCDCSIDCAGGTHFACSGNCTYVASTLVAATITSDGCTTPTTAKGLLTPEGYR